MVRNSTKRAASSGATASPVSTQQSPPAAAAAAAATPNSTPAVSSATPQAASGSKRASRSLSSTAASSDAAATKDDKDDVSQATKSSGKKTKVSTPAASQPASGAKPIDTAPKPSGKKAKATPAPIADDMETAKKSKQTPTADEDAAQPTKRLKLATPEQVSPEEKASPVVVASAPTSVSSAPSSANPSASSASLVESKMQATSKAEPGDAEPQAPKIRSFLCKSCGRNVKLDFDKPDTAHACPKGATVAVRPRRRQRGPPPYSYLSEEGITATRLSDRRANKNKGGGQDNKPKPDPERDAWLRNVVMNKVYDKDAQWCRYCGCEQASGWSRGPWGSRKLCTIRALCRIIDCSSPRLTTNLDYVQWFKKQKLDLSKYVEEPTEPINRAENTEYDYLKRMNAKKDYESE